MIVFLCLTAEDEVVVKEVTLALPSFVFRFFGVTEVPAFVLTIVPECVRVCERGEGAGGQCECV